MSEEYQLGITELRINSKAAISAINSLAKRLEEADKKIVLHESSISNMQETIDQQVIKMNELLAKMYESGIR